MLAGSTYRLIGSVQPLSKYFTSFFLWALSHTGIQLMSVACDLFNLSLHFPRNSCQIVTRFLTANELQLSFQASDRLSLAPNYTVRIQA